MIGRIKSLFGSAFTDNQVDISQIVQNELQFLQQSFQEEKARFQFEFTSDKDKCKRLLFLFQRDLMPGISGQILEAKESRDSVRVKAVSHSGKVLTWCIVIFVNVAMLFYIFLFAVSQESHRQRAWARSFGLWLVMEVFLVSSAMVLFTHVLVPALIMTDVSKVRHRLMGSLQEYHRKMSAAKKKQIVNALDDETKLGDEDSGDSESDEQKGITTLQEFNAAAYLFLSIKMAKLYPELKVAQVIGAFSTPWPKQSYQHASDVTKEYESKFQAISKSITMVVMFFITSFISIPQSVQDMVIHMCTTAISGYTTLLHVRLYHIYPVLVVVPTLLAAAVVHFFVQSNRMKQKLEFARLFGTNPESVEDEVPTFQRKEPVTDGNTAGETSDNVKPCGQQHINRRQSIALGIKIANQVQGMIVADVPQEDSSQSSFALSKEEDYVLSDDSEIENIPLTFNNPTPSTKFDLFASIRNSIIEDGDDIDLECSDSESESDITSDSDSEDL
jgi:Ca2+/Na+ antiporter